MHKIDVGAKILQANEEIAQENKEIFKKHGVFTVNIMSAPGAGKTSVLEETIKRLKDEFAIAVIEGDLQTSVDSDRIKALGIPAYQITTGNVCHLDARMIHNALHDFKLDGFDILFIENVGNLVCPAEFYLGEDLRAMVYSVVEGAEKPKKYPLMFHEVEVVLLNKIDLLPYAGVEIDELKRNVLEVNPTAKIFPISCRTGDGLDEWINWFRNRVKRFKENVKS
ncbi:hydrogenase nickel incorporation protein HypB [Candidatus Chrysopegis kryptomonas]|jgi:hydrogenase nickel incorporation protein HypB|uniref:Hydrogenase nickel incorporation protein HypB n=1 Tax=Candidatus Chryseopegocella kryptomonas TaxID=1633643 RepID=A0A0P1MRE6_9BACT|nr:hydrogenase nickel incorporation protein HypB [Candidatus Chrysopegis kryptomonas]CUS98295.1 hydrogenase nickel incorporation protein HypB [Candidatus Chrysopegis kryptomonas]